MQCPYCQNVNDAKASQCRACGNMLTALARNSATPEWPGNAPIQGTMQGNATAMPLPGPAAARGLMQIFGLHPAAAATMLIVDWMLFGAVMATLGAAWVVSIPVGIAVGIAVYMIQKNMYGDDDATAKTKAFVAALLTAIPAPIPTPFIIASGAMGLIKSWRKK